MMTFELLKKKLKALADDVRYPDPHIREEETDDTWMYSVNSEEFCWHDESYYDGNEVMLSLRKPEANIGYVPKPTPDSWIDTLDDLLPGVKYGVTTYCYESHDDIPPLYSIGRQHIVELLPGTEKGAQVWLMIKHWEGRG